MSKEVGEMVRSRDVVQAEGSARTEGARRATGVRADGADHPRIGRLGSTRPIKFDSVARSTDMCLRPR